MILGDFNTVSTVDVDRSRRTSSLVFNDNLQTFLSQYSMVDNWCFYNLGKRGYTFHFACHNSYSWIDYILVRRNIQQDIEGTGIESKIFSDHAAIRAV